MEFKLKSKDYNDFGNRGPELAKGRNSRSYEVIMGKETWLADCTYVSEVGLSQQLQPKIYQSYDR